APDEVLEVSALEEMKRYPHPGRDASCRARVLQPKSQRSGYAPDPGLGRIVLQRDDYPGQSVELSMLRQHRIDATGKHRPRFGGKPLGQEAGAALDQSLDAAIVDPGEPA